MKNLILIIFVLLFFGNNGFAEEPKTKIEIAPEDQVCTSDDECDMALVDCECSGGGCGGQPVNKLYRDKYIALQKECERKYSESKSPPGQTLKTICDCILFTSVYKCENNRCIVISTPYRRP